MSKWSVKASEMLRFFVEDTHAVCLGGAAAGLLVLVTLATIPSDQIDMQQRTAATGAGWALVSFVSAWLLGERPLHRSGDGWLEILFFGLVMLLAYFGFICLAGGCVALMVHFKMTPLERGVMVFIGLFSLVWYAVASFGDPSA
ncbi:hypothetical protein PQQ96_25490 [Paraburkholderia sediminicola]|uniref:hypothetical protein n=1 Tax=Paraburkholderia sediminicola TaxID=458836 RepID=UPI0038BAB70D